MARVSKIIWIEDDDDGTISLDTIPGMTRQDIFQASLIMTDKGRILKNRTGPANQVIPSFELVKQSVNPPGKKTKTKYRSIFDPYYDSE
jgi:hypothetical protein